jgi:hypothetical protein
MARVKRRAKQTRKGGSSIANPLSGKKGGASLRRLSGIR